MSTEHRPGDMLACGRFTRHGEHRWLDAHGHLHLCLGGW
jgi:hypothetical protein